MRLRITRSRPSQWTVTRQRASRASTSLFRYYSADNLSVLINCRSEHYCSGIVGVKRITRLWRNLRALVRHRRVQLALSIRVTIAALIALALAQFLQLPLPLLGGLTTVIVTQMEASGRSLKATFDYRETLGGADPGGAIRRVYPACRKRTRSARGSRSLPWPRSPSLRRSKPWRSSVAPVTAIIVLIPIQIADPRELRLLRQLDQRHGSSDRRHHRVDCFRFSCCHPTLIHWSRRQPPDPAIEDGGPSASSLPA